MTKKTNFMTPRQIRESCKILNPESPTETQVCAISEEFHQGLNIFEGKKELEKSVTFYGSARFPQDHKYCKEAYNLARRIGEELGYAIVTGGAGGIMEAANHGAFDAHVPSIGMTIVLPAEQNTNKYVTQEIPFDFFFTRKTLLKFSGEAYIFFPGGYGTLDEMFDLITLIQTRKISPAPVIMFGKEFWSPLVDFIKEKQVKEFGTISPDEILFTMTDDHDEIIEIIKTAPIRDGE